MHRRTALAAAALAALACEPPLAPVPATTGSGQGPGPGDVGNPVTFLPWTDNRAGFIDEDGNLCLLELPTESGFDAKDDWIRVNDDGTHTAHYVNNLTWFEVRYDGVGYGGHGRAVVSVRTSLEGPELHFETLMIRVRGKLRDQEGNRVTGRCSTHRRESVLDFSGEIAIW